MIKAIENGLCDRDRTFAGLEKTLPEDAAGIANRHPVLFHHPARSPRPTRSNRSANMSAAARCVSPRPSGRLAQKRSSRKFAEYVPRTEPASWLAGGKRIASDRIEWIIIADRPPRGRAEEGEVDWLELPLPDLVPTLRKTACTGRCS